MGAELLPDSERMSVRDSTALSRDTIIILYLAAL